MSIAPKAIRDLLYHLEASKQSRLRAWNVLRRLRLVRSENVTAAIPPRSLGFDLRSHPEPQLNQMLDLILIPKVHKIPRIGSRQAERTVIFTLKQNVSFSRHR
jgi:hypothetical protein